MIRVLLPTDFSGNANHAIDYAFNLFGFEGVEYLLLNAFVEPHNSADMLVSLNDILQKQSQDELNQAYEQLLEKYPNANINIQKRLENGLLSNVLRQISENKKEKIDYIVMGTKGASGLKKAFLGSNTSAVIKKVKCPIIAVPEKALLIKPKIVALATDYDSLDDSEALQPLTHLARQNKSELMVVNIKKEAVLANGETEMQGMHLGHMFNGIDQSFYSVDNKDIITGVRKFVKNHHVDMLAMISREQSFFERLFVISLTKEMAMVADVPLLILHETA